MTRSIQARFLQHSSWLMAFAAFAIAGCNQSRPEEPYVARVGTDYLYESDLEAAFKDLPAADSSSARSQFVDRWISSALLAREARRRGIDTDVEVQRLLRDNERSILASSLVEQVFDETLGAAQESAIKSYYEENRDRLRIREPYVRIRYLATGDRTRAEEARRLLQRALRGGGVDSLWAQIVSDNADDPAGSLYLTSTYFPQSRLFASSPKVKDRLLQLGDGQLASIIEDSDQYHVIQLVDRVPSGTVPELEWIRDDLARQREQQTQKETYARLVQRLRAEANAQNQVEIR